MSAVAAYFRPASPSWAARTRSKTRARASAGTRDRAAAGSSPCRSASAAPWAASVSIVRNASCVSVTARSAKAARTGNWSRSSLTAMLTHLNQDPVIRGGSATNGVARLSTTASASRWRVRAAFRSRSGSRPAVSGDRGSVSGSVIRYIASRMICVSSRYSSRASMASPNSRNRLRDLTVVAARSRVASAMCRSHQRTYRSCPSATASTFERSTRYASADSCGRAATISSKRAATRAAAFGAFSWMAR